MIDRDDAGVPVRATALLASAATTMITPARPGPLAGYAARAGAVSTGTHDDLAAGAVWLRSGPDDAGLIWLALDVIGVTPTLRDVCRRRLAMVFDRVPELIIAASHTHAAPSGWVGSIHPGHPADVDPVAVAELGERLSGLFAAVHDQSAVEVRPTFAERPVAGVGSNRLHPGGPYDPTVGILTLQRISDDKPAAVIIDHGCHPTVLPAANLQHTADWPGACRRRISAALPGEPPVLFLQGAAGDISTRFVRSGQTFAEADRIGARLADQVLEASLGARSVDGAPMIIRSGLLVPGRVVPDHDQARVAVAEADAALAALPAEVDHGPTRIAQTRLDGARVLAELAAADLPDRWTLPITAVALGDLAWIHLPVEPFASLGLRIKRASPYRRTRVIGYTDGYFGYLPDAEAIANGSYEALSSLFDEAGAEAVVAGAVTLLTTLHRQAPHDL
ncbi:hypothetical protein [Microlunatus parietis]|uniref:Neutral/alkaline non-lysosomal ceramidase, N-terminal n=1 Tax=Microlunatus parietis TaxID=682979 RepID=A0A7Y9I9M1_9ACTN|nr:hypothetical protein [Microlunatus parietis]NYE72881.1 hypothetical protein [Microlunatus parietis]